MITLVLGGARSGKSAFAEDLATGLRPPVTYVATMQACDDPELAERVEAHRRRRDPTWATVEAVEPGDDLPGVLGALVGTVLVDSLGPWVAARFEAADVEADADALCSALMARTGDTVLVSDEVGLSVHPSSAEGRRFRDALGTVNYAASLVADRAFLVVAGRALALPAPGPAAWPGVRAAAPGVEA